MSSHVKGLHLNFIAVAPMGCKTLLSILLGKYFPRLVGFQPEDVERLFPFMSKVLIKLLMESGYFHIQSTKPDTVGKNPLLISFPLLIFACRMYCRGRIACTSRPCVPFGEEITRDFGCF